MWFYWMWMTNFALKHISWQVFNIFSLISKMYGMFSGIFKGSQAFILYLCLICGDFITGSPTPFVDTKWLPAESATMERCPCLLAALFIGIYGRYEKSQATFILKLMRQVAKRWAPHLYGIYATSYEQWTAWNQLSIKTDLFKLKSAAAGEMYYMKSIEMNGQPCNTFMG